MLLDTEERRKRKEKVTDVEGEVGERSLVDTVRSGDLSLVTRLVTGQDKDQEIVSAGLVAAREGFPDSLKILLDTGKLEADLTDENGWTFQRTALRAACWAGHLDCVKELLEAGAEINQVDSE